MRYRPLVALLFLALGSVAFWRISRPSEGVLHLSVHEGRVRLDTPAGSLEVPAGAAARASRMSAPTLLSEAAAEEGWRAPLMAGEKIEEISPEPVWKGPLREKLKQTVHFRFDGIPFQQAKEFLEAQGKVVIHVDRLAREAKTGLNEVPVHLATPEEGVTLEMALNYLARAVGLCWGLRDETITVTTREGLREPPEFRVYDVRDLLGDPADFKPTPNHLLGYVRAFFGEQVWDSESHRLRCEEGRLLVTAPASVHARIPDVLNGLRAFQAAKPPIPDDATPEPAWKLSLREKLKKTVRFKFDGVTFQEAKEYLEMQGKLVINVDAAARKEIPDLGRLPVHLTSPEKGAALESALNALAREVGLTWGLRDESIVIATESALEEPPEFRRYDVRDLVLAKVFGEENANVTGDKISDVLKENVEPWGWVGAGRTLEYSLGAIHATAPPSTHAKLRQALKELRRSMGR